MGRGNIYATRHKAHRAKRLGKAKTPPSPYLQASLEETNQPGVRERSALEQSGSPIGTV